MGVPITFSFFTINHFDWPIEEKLKQWRPTQIKNYVPISTSQKQKKPSNSGALTRYQHFYYDISKSEFSFTKPLEHVQNDQLKRQSPFYM
jgi:hypothetical protein